MTYWIEKITVEGFRGFREKKELQLTPNLVIVYGPQRSGKSSLLNAPRMGLARAGHCQKATGTAGHPRTHRLANTKPIQFYLPGNDIAAHIFGRHPTDHPLAWSRFLRSSA